MTDELADKGKAIVESGKHHPGGGFDPEQQARLDQLAAQRLARQAAATRVASLVATRVAPEDETDPTERNDHNPYEDIPPPEPPPDNDPGPADPPDEPSAAAHHGAQLLDDVKTFLARFVVYPSAHALVAHVLWIAHTWLMDSWESTPRIAFLSPEPGSGKSRALEVTEPVVPRPVHAVNCTPAYLFRKVSDPDGAPTILYDECDTLFGPKAKDHEEIRGMLNAGHRKGATAGRCVVRGKIVETEELPAYCAVALAGLDDLPDTIMTRSVIIRMRRRSPAEPIEPWRRRVNAPQADKLRERLIDWSNLVRDDAADTWPEMPAGVQDRAADVWEPLVAVADLAGGHWPNTARVAAVTAVTEAMAARPSLGVMLLQDIRTVFARLAVRNLVTDELLTNLREIEEGPWAVIRKGDPIDSRRLASLLRKYGIEPKPQRDGDRVFKGYARSQFEDAWSRYLPPLGPADIETVTAVTHATDGTMLRCETCDTDLVHADSVADGHCTECRVSTGGTV